MIVPKPPVTLEGDCSVIYDNTFYAYSSNGFVSIPLERNATWSKLSMGEAVSDAACVIGSVDKTDQKALYVIGGTGGSSGYSGLQRYPFQDKKWSTLTPSTDNLANRTGHGVAYLQSASSIFIYGGSQTDGSQATSENFVMGSFAPYNLMSSDTDKVPPATSPVLLAWSDDQVALMRGATDPNSIHLFQYSNSSQTTGTWTRSNTTLTSPISDDVKCALISGSNATKMLETFDMSVSPNNVTTTVLLNDGGKPAPSGETVGSSSSKRKRESTVDSYPKYDDTLASTTTRSQYALAQGNDGLVVISSGSGTDSLSIFNQTSNSWVNTTKLFYGNESRQQILASASPTATASATPSASSSAAAASTNNNSSSKTGTIIGATLGAVLGVAAVLVIILFLLKQKKEKRKRAVAQAQGGANDKDRLSFQDQGMEPLTQAAYPMAKSPVPMASSSVDSLGIFSGKANNDRSSGAKPSFGSKLTAPKPSPLSTIQSSGMISVSDYGDADKSFEAQESIGGRPGDRRTNEGWSKYFQDNSATDIVGMEPENSTSASEAKSQARNSAWPMTTLTPLNFGFLDEPKPLGRVFSGSPTTEHPNNNDGRGLVIPESQSARISSADSISLASEGTDYRHSGIRDSQWTGAGQNSWLGRPSSSTYSGSFYNNSIREVPSTYETRPYDLSRTNARRSSVLIPETLDEPPHPANVNSDMSWLNLNADR